MEKTIKRNQGKRKAEKINETGRALLKNRCDLVS